MTATVGELLDERRIRPRSWHGEDFALLGGSLLSSFALVWALFGQLTPLSGAIGFAVTWFASFLLTYWLVVREATDAVRAKDRVMAAAVAVGGLAVVAPLIAIVTYTVAKGIGALTPGFFTQTLEFTGPLSAADAGGALHAIVGTLEQVGIAAAVSVPLGVATAVFLNEVGGRLARPVRMIVDAMSAIPSIVAGLFIYAVLILQLGLGQSGLAAGLSLAVLMLPTVTRTAEVVLRLVPSGLREASLALGAEEWRTTTGVVLPTARGGLITAVVLGVARVVGETAPLILTAGGAFVLNSNPFAGKQDSLPLFVFRLVKSPQTAQIERAWTGALVLIAIVLALFVLARTLGGARAVRGGGRALPGIPRRRRTPELEP